MAVLSKPVSHLTHFDNVAQQPPIFIYPYRFINTKREKDMFKKLDDRVTIAIVDTQKHKESNLWMTINRKVKSL
jgi:hypothetical protein